MGTVAELRTERSVVVDSGLSSLGKFYRMNILGISAFYHDSAACLVRDGEIIAAVQEERFTRKKHDPSFPRNAINYCLKEGDIKGDQLDYVGFYDKPFIKFERILDLTFGNSLFGYC